VNNVTPSLGVTLFSHSFSPHDQFYYSYRATLFTFWGFKEETMTKQVNWAKKYYKDTVTYSTRIINLYSTELFTKLETSQRLILALLCIELTYYELNKYLNTMKCIAWDQYCLNMNTITLITEQCYPGEQCYLGEQCYNGWR